MGGPARAERHPAAGRHRPPLSQCGGGRFLLDPDAERLGAAEAVIALPEPSGSAADPHASTMLHDSVWGSKTICTLPAWSSPRTCATLSPASARSVPCRVTNSSISP